MKYTNNLKIARIALSYNRMYTINVMNENCAREQNETHTVYYEQT